MDNEYIKSPAEQYVQFGHDAYNLNTPEGFKEAEKWYLKAAELGDDQAMCSLGYLYFYGRLGTPDKEKAREYFERSAELGNFEAILKVGDFYKYGTYGEEDPDKAFEAYTKVFDSYPDEYLLYFPELTLRLAQCEYDGTGTEVSYNKALMLADLAAKGFDNDDEPFYYKSQAKKAWKLVMDCKEKLGTPESIYEKILKSLDDDGNLPQGFSLARQEHDAEIILADGAFDGVSAYHFRKPEIEEDTLDLMKSAVNAAAEDDITLANKLFTELSEKISAFGIIEEFQQYIFENSGKLGNNNLIGAAFNMLTQSNNIECVKFAMSIIELYDIQDTLWIRKAVTRLGYCNEFTLFTIFIMGRWDDANEEIFNLAKKVTGWGRIHCISYLEGDKDYIRDWLLYEGLNNHIMPEYSAVPCIVKSEVAERLERGISEKEFHAIGGLISPALPLDPVASIFGLANGKDIVEKWLDCFKTFEAKKEDYETVLYILEEVKEQDIRGNIADKCEEILSSEGAKKAAGDVAEKFLGLDYREDPEE